MILEVHVHGERPYEIGDEIWEWSLALAIEDAAEILVGRARSELPAAGEPTNRHALKQRIVAEMTDALVKIGDRYRGPDGVLYSLADQPAIDMRAGAGTIGPVNDVSPTVEEVLRFEDLPLGSNGSRRAIVRWSDGSESSALTWYSDEVMVCEGDLVGQTAKQLRALHFRRDRDWLRS